MGELENRATPDVGLQTRYVELRADGERTINGTLMRYGDVAEFFWGDREKFEPGCFGDVRKVDFILDKQHERGRPLARSGGGGVVLTDSLSTLELRADLPDTTDANDTLALVHGNVLRGLSVSFMPIDYRTEYNQDGSQTIIHIRSELRGGGVVDRPQYKQSTLRAEFESLRQQTEDTGMDEKETRALVDEILAKRDAAAPDFSGMMDTALERFESSVSGKLTTMRDEVTAALAKREEEAAEKAAEAERMGDMDGKKKKKPMDMAKDDDMDDDDKDKMPKDMAERFDVEVRERADLVIQVRGLLADDYDFTGKSRHEILVAAAGDEVERADERSDDYLHAKIENIIERRANAGRQNDGVTQQNRTGGNGTNNGAPISAPVSVHSVVMARNAAAAKVKIATE